MPSFVRVGNTMWNLAEARFIDFGVKDAKFTAIVHFEDGKTKTFKEKEAIAIASAVRPGGPDGLPEFKGDLKPSALD